MAFPSLASSALQDPAERGARDAVSSLAQVREQLGLSLPTWGRRAQDLLALWAASLEIPPPAEEVDRVLTHGRVQLELRQPELDPMGVVDAARRAALECGAVSMLAALRQPYSKALLLMALR